MIRLPGNLFSMLPPTDGATGTGAEAAGPGNSAPFGDVLRSQTGARGELAGLPGLLRASGNFPHPGGKDFPLLPLQAQELDGLPALLPGNRLGQQMLGADAELGADGELPALAELADIDMALTPEDGLVARLVGLEEGAGVDATVDPALLAPGAILDTETSADLSADAGQAAALIPELTTAVAADGPDTVVAPLTPLLAEQPAQPALQAGPERAVGNPFLGAAIGEGAAGGQMQAADPSQWNALAELNPGNGRAGQLPGALDSNATAEFALDPAELAGVADLARSRPAQAGQPQPVVAMPIQVIPESAVSATSRVAELPPMDVPVSDPEWGNELAGRVNLLIKNGSQEASLQLNPPELGRLDIRIVTDGDQARVQFAVQNAEARELIEQNMPRLRDMLEQGGLQLARGDVADQSQGRERDNSGTLGLGTGADDGFDDTAERQDMAVPMQFASAEDDGRVDYYV